MDFQLIQELSASRGATRCLCESIPAPTALYESSGPRSKFIHEGAHVVCGTREAATVGRSTPMPGRCPPAGASLEPFSKETKSEANRRVPTVSVGSGRQSADDASARGAFSGELSTTCLTDARTYSARLWARPSDEGNKCANGASLSRPRTEAPMPHQFRKDTRRRACPGSPEFWGGMA